MNQNQREIPTLSPAKHISQAFSRNSNSFMEAKVGFAVHVAPGTILKSYF